MSRDKREAERDSNEKKEGSTLEAIQDICESLVQQSVHKKRRVVILGNL
jgi:hypothetical protein